MARTRRRDAAQAPPQKPISDIAPEDSEMTAAVQAADTSRTSPPGAPRQAHAPDRQPDPAPRQPDPASGQADRSNEEEIRKRAYQRYEARGRGEGRADEDWYEAEKELRSRR